MDRNNQNNNLPDFFGGTYENFQASLYKSFLNFNTQRNNELPTADLSFYRAIDPRISSRLNNLADKVLVRINHLLQSADLAGFDGVGEITEIDEFDSWNKDIISLTDSLIDATNSCLDEFTGRTKKIAAPSVQSTPVVAKVMNSRDKPGSSIVYVNNISRPQLKFNKKVDNSASPFIPKLIEKPNATVPLVTYKEDDDITMIRHPYEYEIKHLKLPSRMFEKSTPIPFKPVETTNRIWVESKEDLLAMCEKLENSTEIAVDLEHHEYRSYQGFTCLMQISTRDEDFIVDTLALRSELQILNRSFTNPDIVKIFHGSDLDVLWLQKDFAIYIVNLFDTYHASVLLGLPQHSLAYLLKLYCNVDSNKQYQLADWRIRPLPVEMLEYARADTHYLLFIYDTMRNNLIDKSDPETLNLLRVELGRSSETSLKTYEKFGYDENGEGPNGYKRLLAKWKTTFDTQQMEVFKALHAWRDHIAREEDEKRMPDEPRDLVACCRTVVPPIVRMNLIDLARLISDSKRSKVLLSSIYDQPAQPNEIDDQTKKESTLMDGVEFNEASKMITDTTSMDEDSSSKDISKHISERSILFGNYLDEVDIQNENMELVKRIESSFDFSLPIPKKITYPNQ
nr:2048_t:CDS:10 [Entrophospora candida]